MIYDKKAETMKDSARKKLQLSRLKDIVSYCYDKVDFYRKKMDAVGVKPSHIKKLTDIEKLPFTTKIDLRDNYPFGLFAVPMRDIVRIHASSGTTGKPTVVGYTKHDIVTWSEVMARTLACCGATQDTVIQNAYGYGLFTGGLGVHYGAERLGATVIPVSVGNTPRQLMLMEDFKADLLCSTPSYALHIAEVAKEKGIDLKKLPLKFGAFGAEPWSNEMRKEIEARLNVRANDIFGLSEVIGPGVSSECEVQKGLHIFDDHFLPEIIDPNTFKPLPYGKDGELVFTTLTKEGFPVLRYRTKDITSLDPTPCACGRTHVRMQRISGRTDDMLIIRGVNVFPSQIESVLVQIEGAEPHYQIIVRREGALDELEVQVEVNEKLFSDEVRKLEALEKKIVTEIESVLGITVRVKLIEPKGIKRSEGKAQRVIDMRKEQGAK
ncbi:MAG: phenylacetate--CoA ligase [Spirochaetes bacterium]|nr:phenylacetate--CoA ligase [Spirochaetota bacterium]